MIEQEITNGFVKGGIGGLTFITLVDSLKIEEYLTQLLLSLAIILIQAFVIPLIKFAFKKLKERIKASKEISEDDKQELAQIVDKVSDKVTDKVNNVTEDLKENIKEKE